MINDFESILNVLITNGGSFINDNFSTGLVISVLLCIIKQVRPAVIEAYTHFKEYMITKIATSKYAQQSQVALSIWYQVEEDFRIGEAVTELFETKAAYFNSLLLKKFPNLTQSDLDTLRQAISGMENANKIN